MSDVFVSNSLKSIEFLKERIAQSEERSGRPQGSVKILPVSKGQSAEKILDLLRSPGAPSCLGENYLEEFQQKKSSSLLSHVTIQWHFLGRLQSRKVLEVAQLADVIQTVSRLKEINLLATAPRIPNFFVQVNTSSEPQKGGCDPSELPSLADHIAKLGLASYWSGLMTIPSPLELIGERALRQEFGQLRALRDEHVPRGTLSMGMSGDFEIAIEEGADWVRIGTALFGERSR